MKTWIPLIIIHSFTFIGCATSGQNITTTRPDNERVVLTTSPTPSSGDKPGVASPKLEKHQKKAQEQSSFSAEEEIKVPVNVPADVLRLLRRDERNQTCLKESESANDIQASWFTASEISLNDNDPTDLIVKPNNPCLLGANIDPFWIFRNTPQGYEQVLNVSTLGLEVLDTKTKGYRDIRIMAATANEVLITIYNFNGREYKAVRSWREPI